MSQNVPTDEKLLALLKTNGSEGIELIFKKYYRDLCIVANRYLRDENHAEDIVQELLYDIWNKRDELKITSSFGSYLKRSAINRSLNHLRSKKINFEQEDIILGREDKISSVQQKLEGEEMENYINKQINALPEKCRLVFVMSRFDQLSYKEIAEKLDISIKTVENQISKALKTLRKAINEGKNYI